VEVAIESWENLLEEESKEEKAKEEKKED